MDALDSARRNEWLVKNEPMDELLKGRAHPSPTRSASSHAMSAEPYRSHIATKLPRTMELLMDPSDDDAPITARLAWLADVRAGMEQEHDTSAQPADRSGTRKRIITPPSRGQGKGRAKSPARSEMIGSPVFERGNYSPTRHGIASELGPCGSLVQSTSYQGIGLQPSAPIIVNVCTESASSGNPHRSELVATDQKPIRSSARRPRPIPPHRANTNTTSAPSTAGLNSTSSYSGQSLLSTAVTSEPPPTRAEATPTTRMEDRGPHVGDGQALRFACPWARMFGKDGKQRCIGEFSTGFRDMGRVK
jgi:hypothetical protein